MRQQRTPQEIEASDPAVSHWLLECGFLDAPVQFRLKSNSRSDLELQINRLQSTYGDEVRIGSIDHNRMGNEFIAYGAFLR